MPLDDMTDNDVAASAAAARVRRVKSVYVAWNGPRGRVERSVRPTAPEAALGAAILQQIEAAGDILNPDLATGVIRWPDHAGRMIVIGVWEDITEDVTGGNEVIIYFADGSSKTF